MNTSARKRMMGLRGFTLIELLVVISIIAVLLSIMTPALQRVREQARATMCASNQGQINMALLLYAENNQGRVPYFSNPLFSASTKEYLVTTDGWLGAILPYVGDVGYELITFQGNQWYREKDFAKIGNCPSIKHERPYPWSYGVNYPVVIDYSGKLAASVGNQKANLFPFLPPRISEFHSRTLVFMDAQAWQWWVYNMVAWPMDTDPDNDGVFQYNSHPHISQKYNGASFPHKNMANVSFIDGSVRRLGKKEITENFFDMWAKGKINPRSLQ